jgi:hypothetical protein
MQILGRAIGDYLARTSGQFSVILHRRLQEDLIGLVNQCLESTGEDKRALLITDEPIEKVESCGWQDLLSWRTGHDRIFAWVRGSGQPDSSFQSVVQPFIDETFPSKGSESACTLPLLAKVCLDYIWGRHDLDKGTNVYDKFLEVLARILQEARDSFLRCGNTALLSWNDQFLLHCSSLVQGLEQVVAERGPSLAEPQAWEIQRLAGLPAWVEDTTKDDVFLAAPTLPKKTVAMAKDWERVVEKFITGPRGVGELLGELDRILEPQGRGPHNSWWGLLDDESATYDPSEDAPLLYGQRLFSLDRVPALHSQDRPGLRSVPQYAWWGVVSEDLAKILKEIGESQPLRPADDDIYLFPIPSMPGKYILRTHQGTVEHDHKKSSWQAKVRLEGVAVVYDPGWPDLVIGSPAEEGRQLGQVCVLPETIKIACSPQGGVTCQVNLDSIQLGSSKSMQVEFDVDITYKADREESTGYIMGKWQSRRWLKITFLTQVWDGQEWMEPKSVESKIRVFIPHPFELTMVLNEAKNDKKSKFFYCPDDKDVFFWEEEGEEEDSMPSWSQNQSIDVQIREDGEMNIVTYDGRLNPTQPTFLDQVTSTRPKKF